MVAEIANAIQEIQQLTNAKALDAYYRKGYAKMPADPESFVAACDELVSSGNWRAFWLVTLWIKRRQSAYELAYFDVYQKWLLENIHSWGACDVFCYRVLNPMIEKFPQLFDAALTWAHSEKVYVRRASAVCLIQSTRASFRVNAEFNRVETICDLLKDDPHIHIQKAVGWLLKYAYLTFPGEVEGYLRANLSTLSRTTFRYALEKMPPATRVDFMRL